MIQNRLARETVFDNGGAPWPFFSQVAAINYDNGGQGFGYNVPSPDAANCPAGSSYRSDAVNLKTSVAGAPAIPFQIGCEVNPNSFNYTVNISQSGPYQITLQLADDAPGGSWNVLLDGLLVATVPTPNTGSFDTFASSTSGSFSASLGNHQLTLAFGTPDSHFGSAGDFLTWQGSKAPPTTINSVGMDCGTSCGFVAGTAGTVGTATAVMSTGSFTGTWSLRTSQTDNFGITCHNYSGGFTINSSSGVVSNGALAAGSYPGVCIVATQGGAGGSPFALAVTITGVTSGQPVGPNPAQVANFTTCVICMDFTAPTGGVWVNGLAVSGVNAGQANTWLDCAGASSPIMFHASGGGQALDDMPCPDITGDGAGNSQVLHFNDISTSSGNVPTGTANALFSHLGNNGIGFPTNLYFEATYWIANFPVVQNFYGYNFGHWLGGQDGPGMPNYNALEFDTNEINDNPHVCGGLAAGAHSWGGSTPGSGGNGGLFSLWFSNCPSNYVDATTGYHNWAVRITSDGSTITQCEWVDGVQLGPCGQQTASNSGPLYPWQLSDQFSRFNGQVACCQNGSGVTQAGPFVIFYKSFNAWSCSNWQTTACTTSSADPGNF